MADFTMYSGDTKVLEVTVRDPQGAVVDITGKAITWALSPTVNSSSNLIDKTVGDGLTIINGAAGRYNVLLNPIDTVDLQGSYYHESLLDDNGTISTIMAGKAQILATLL